MKRRSQKRPKRDWEAETLKKMTTLTLTEKQMRERLLADKAALEVKLKELFDFRRFMNFAKGSSGEAELNELIKGISEELRVVKAQLR